MKGINLTIALVAFTICNLVVTPIHADDYTVSRATYTIIEDTRNGVGVLLNQTMKSITTGYNISGEYYTIVNTVNYIIKNNKAYALSSITVQRSESCSDEDFTETTDYVTYIRDANGKLIGATGYRLSISYAEENDTSSVQTGKLIFAMINGQAEVKEWCFKAASLKGHKTDDVLKTLNFSTLSPTDADLTSYSEGKTIYSYETVHGLTKTQLIHTIQDVWSFGEGTPDPQVEKQSFLVAVDNELNITGGILAELKTKGYIDANGKVTDKFKALDNAFAMTIDIDIKYITVIQNIYDILKNAETLNGIVEKNDFNGTIEIIGKTTMEGIYNTLVTKGYINTAGLINESAFTNIDSSADMELGTYQTQKDAIYNVFRSILDMFSTIKDCPIDNTKTYVYYNAQNKSISAYDAYGNLVPTLSTVTHDGGKIYIAGQPNPICIGDLELYLAKTSYNISFTKGITNTSDGWSFYNQNSFSLLDVRNGQNSRVWTTQEYFNELAMP